MPNLPSARGSKEVDPATRTMWSLLLSGGGLAMIATGMVWFAVEQSPDSHKVGTLAVYGLVACVAAPVGVVIARGKVRVLAGILATLSLGLLLVAVAFAS
jgi:hypothetical protein